jgi:hydrogenase maturation factor
MQIPYFMAKHDHVFSVSKDVYSELISGKSTHVEYTVSRKVNVGDYVNIHPYDSINKIDGDTVVNAQVKTIKEVPVKSGSIKRFVFGLNVQLIMF